MRGFNKPSIFWFVTIITTVVIGGIKMIATFSKTWALWGGIALLILAGLLMIALVVMLITKRGIIMSKDKDDKQTNIIKDTEVKATVKHAKEALGADFEGDYELENVKVKLEAENVEQATGARFKSSNGSTPMTLMSMSCSNCGKILPKVFTGHLPEETACPHCGHMNKVEK